MSHILSGKVLTYKQVAEKAGSPRAYRTVGNILKKNYDPVVSCHHVVCSDENVSDHNGGARKKESLLKKEMMLQGND